MLLLAGLVTVTVAKAGEQNANTVNGRERRVFTELASEKDRSRNRFSGNRYTMIIRCRNCEREMSELLGRLIEILTRR